ncbi:hypothetical protein [Photobacterium aquimaris]|uniref:DUF1311 domain-containing protein n=1 Tax=Photobacterium aquimaris TaxID=512643 RepID=A0A2T3HUY5_9GAMM|nr:hypothetical protein [Photobacterium aquimaris]OBU14156.1 hypothetical protein AYY21_07155 [Photobacterium aquimaris]PSU01550.1 hypothetical protein C0W81_15480 [Photobacterium aquimaris]
MSSLFTKALLITVTLSALFSTAANATNSIVVQSCVTNPNFDEQGLIDCLQQAKKNAKDQVYNLTDQGNVYNTKINTQCNDQKNTIDQGPIKRADKAKLAICYANAWSAARDKLLGENYTTKLTTDVYKAK